MAPRRGDTVGARSRPARPAARQPRGHSNRRAGATTLIRPLYQAKAEFFKTLAHPARIRVLELLSERDHQVAELLPEVGIEAAHLSQQLAVLRKAGLVTSRREGSSVVYSLTSPKVAELLTVARGILTEVLSGQAELLADLRATAETTGRPRGG